MWNWLIWIGFWALLSLKFSFIEFDLGWIKFEFQWINDLGAQKKAKKKNQRNRKESETKKP